MKNERKKAFHNAENTEVLLITGMSGSGRTFALKVLEDIGFETIDNLPIRFLQAVTLSRNEKDCNLAISIDVRTRDFAAEAILREYQKLCSYTSLKPQLIFFDCDDDVLTRRYNETRRLHPLAHERPVIEGIQLERQLLSSVKDRANSIIDTTHMLPSDLRGQMYRFFLKEEEPHFSIFITSFSFRHGLPREADMIFDARLLKNPHYVEELKNLTGEDTMVKEFIENDPYYHSFIEQLKSVMSLSIPRFQEDGRNYLTIGIGCTGGQHRSVFIASQLNKWLHDSKNHVKLKHRDLQKRKIK